jgi:hypothetical protein
MPRAYGTTNAAPYAAAPAVGAAGDTYFNTTSKLTFISDGTQWIAMGGAGGSGGPSAVYRYNGTDPTSIASGTVVLNTLHEARNGAAAYVSDSPPVGYDFTLLSTGWVTVGKAGWYMVRAQAMTGSNVATAGSWISIRKNVPAPDFPDAEVAGITVCTKAMFVAIAYSSVNVVWMGWLKVGDQVAMYQSATQNLAVPPPGTAHGNDPFGPTLTIAAVTGATGAAGAPGLPGNAAVTGGFFYGSPSVGLALTGGTNSPITWTCLNGGSFTPLIAAQGAALSPTQAGRYLVSAQITVSNGAAASAWCIAQIEHYNSGGALIATRQVVGPGCGANNYTQVDVSGVFDMVVGDYVRVIVNPNAAGNLDGRSFVEITPVGGATGPQGPDVTAVQSSWFYGQGNASTPNFTANTYNAIQWNTLINNGFTLANPNVTITRAGKYRVATQVSGYANANSGSILSTRITQYDSTATVKVQRVTQGVLPNFSGGWFAGTCEAILDCAVGDIIQVAIQPNVVCVFDSADSWLEITPIGGVKGDAGPIGPTGAPGAGAGTGFVARGDWVNTTAYNPMEVVTKNGVAFLAMAASTGVDPGSLPAGSFAAISDVLASIAAIGKQLTWVPAVHQPSNAAAIPITINSAWYSRIGEWVIGEFSLSITGSGTAGQFFALDLPVPIRTNPSGMAMNIGTAYVYQAGNNYPILYQSGGNQNQVFFALGSNYMSTQLVNGNNMSGYFVYLAPVGV